MSFIGRLARAAIFCLPALASAAADLRADQAQEALAASLPNLPAAQGPGYLTLGAESARIGYRTPFEKWGAKVDQFRTLNPSVTMDYGLQLTNHFGAGGLFIRQNDYSEVVVNGIYAPQRNLRFRMTGAQLRGAGGFRAADGPAGFLQNSYLVGAKKQWGQAAYLSDLGIAAYSVEASAPRAATLPAAGDDDAPQHGQRLSGAVPGRLDGVMLNFGLRPTPQSKLELRRDAGSLTHTFDTGVRREEQRVSNGISYSHDLGNCLRLQGGYSASANAGRVDLRLARHNWNIRLSRAQESGGGNTAIQFGYTIPLGKTGRPAPDCARPAASAPALEPLLEAAVQRPQQLPREPLPAAAP